MGAIKEAYHDEVLKVTNYIEITSCFKDHLSPDTKRLMLIEIKTMLKERCDFLYDLTEQQIDFEMNSDEEINDVLVDALKYKLRAIESIKIESIVDFDSAKTYLEKYLYFVLDYKKLM